MLTIKRAAFIAALPCAAATAVAPAAAAPAASVPTPSTGGAALAQPTSTTPDALATIGSRSLTAAPARRLSVGVRVGTLPVHVELRAGKTGHTLAATDLPAGARHTLRLRAQSGTRVWLRTRTQTGETRTWTPVGRVRTLRPALASWYGPGLYGRRTACGQTLTPSIHGVAHKSLPCGTRVVVKYGGRSTTAVVIDRGPYSGAREFDLTNATARAIGFGSVGRVWVAQN